MSTVMFITEPPSWLGGGSKEAWLCILPKAGRGGIISLFREILWKNKDLNLPNFPNFFPTFALFGWVLREFCLLGEKPLGERIISIIHP